MQPPFDILANEALHPLGPMGLQEAADRFLDHRVPAVEPALVDECVDLAIQTVGDFRFDSFHGSSPGPHGKKTLDYSISRGTSESGRSS
jgi:hypothetical protein